MGYGNFWSEQLEQIKINFSNIAQCVCVAIFRFSHRWRAALSWLLAAEGDKCKLHVATEVWHGIVSNCCNVRMHILECGCPDRTQKFAWSNNFFHSIIRYFSSIPFSTIQKWFDVFNKLSEYHNRSSNPVFRSSFKVCVSEMSRLKALYEHRSLPFLRINV